MKAPRSSSAMTLLQSRREPYFLLAGHRSALSYGWLTPYKFAGRQPGRGAAADHSPEKSSMIILEQCGSNDGCGTGFCNEKRVCDVPKQGQPYREGTCALGYACEHGHCKRLATERISPCQSDVDCAPGFICRAGGCRLLAPYCSCTGHEHCPLGYVCGYSRYCVPDCTTSSTCLGGKECRELSGDGAAPQKGCFSRPLLAKPPCNRTPLVIILLLLVALIVVLVVWLGRRRRLHDKNAAKPADLAVIYRTSPLPGLPHPLMPSIVEEDAAI